MSIYLKIDGIDGNVTAKTYEKCVEAFDVDFGGISKYVGMEVGKKMNRFSPRPEFSEVTIMKNLDESSHKFFEASHTNQVISSVEINYVTANDPKITYAKTTLSNVMVTHYSENFNSELQHPEELIRFAFEKIERTYIPRDSSNQPKSPLISGYAIDSAEKM